MEYVVLIPAYRPGAALLETVEELRAAGVRRIVVVDDGSGPAYQPIFDALRRLPELTVLGHAVNMGKGAALKTGVNSILYNSAQPLLIVTADADGQHATEDIVAVAEAGCAKPGALILGVRQFAEGVPLRSRIGNEATRVAMHILVGQKLSDTQTGLRAIPPALQRKLLPIKSTGYEFELDMLLLARDLHVKIVEQPIRTIYRDQNASSHFNPLFDSMRIYFVLFRFLIASVMTAVIDNASFLIAYYAGAGLVTSQVIARLAAILFNYPVVKAKVFHAAESRLVTGVRYLLVVCLSAAASVGLIHVLGDYARVPVPQAKLLAEAALFLVNFVALRDFVFRATSRAEHAARTDWTAYYRKPFPASRLTRKYTGASIAAAISRFADADRPLIVSEWGGANSCFFDLLDQRFRIREYHVFDSNRYGLDLLAGRGQRRAELIVHEEDVLDVHTPVLSDVVFSIGLIEHFDPQRTAQAIHSHLALLKPGGVLILSYPTPTPLYRLVRFLAELLSQWKFPDERPLRWPEVGPTVTSECEVHQVRTLWPLLLTQQMVVATKRAPVGQPFRAAAVLPHGAPGRSPAAG